MKIDDVVLLEAETPKIFNEIINSEFFKNCILPYLPDTDVLTDGHIKEIPFLYHGGTLKSKTKIYNINLRKTSTDTPSLLHGVINDITQEKFGYPVRNLFFASKRKSTAEVYGNVSIIIPLDDYTLFYSDEVHDMYMDIRFSRNDLFDNYKSDTAKILNTFDIMDKIEKIEKSLDAYPNKKSDKKSLREKMHREIIGGITHVELGPFDIIADEEISTLKDIRSLYNIATVSKVRDYLLGTVTDMFGIEAVYDSEDSERIFETLGDIAKEITKTLIKTAIRFVNVEAKEYTDTVIGTKDSAEIPEDHEVMCTPGRYAILRVDDLDLSYPLSSQHPIVRLQKAYKERS